MPAFDRGSGENSGVWKWVSGVLAAAVCGLLGTIYGVTRDTITKSDLVTAIATQQKQIDADEQRTVRLENSLYEINVSLGEVKGALGIHGKGP